MATSQGKREILLTARAAADLSNASLSGKNTPYLEITIMDATVKTNPDKESSVNPVWDEVFKFKVPGASPGEEPLVIHVTAKHQVTAPLIPDSTIGKGSVPLVQLWSKGSEEVKVPLTDSFGQPAGAAFIGVKVETPMDEKEIPSASGTVLGQVFKGPQGDMALGDKEVQEVPTAHVPHTPLVGAVAPGNIDDPSSPAYGILKD